MTIESVDKLREACKGHMYTGCNDIPHLICDAFGIGHRPYNWGSVLIPVCDAIEAEIAERYMELPVDADGVPIHVGDRLYVHDREFVANGVTLYHNTWRVVTDFASFDDGYQMRWAKDCRHVKPRTLEDVLADVVTLCANTWKDGESPFAFYDVSDVMESGNIREYADEIRELLGKAGD